MFMQVLAQGSISLYSAENIFYLVEKGPKKYILDKKADKIKRIDDETGKEVRTIAIEDKRYLGLMIFLVGDCPKLSNRINDLAFAPAELTKVVNTYNKWKEPKTSYPDIKKTGRPAVSFGLKFDYLVNDMENYIKTSRYYNDNFAKKTCYSGGVVVNMNLNGKFSLQTEALLTQRKSYVYSENPYGIPPEILNFDMVYLEMPLCIYYTLPTKRIQPHVFAGGLAGTKISDKSEIQTIHSFTSKMDPLELGYRAGGGLTFSITGNTKLRIEYYYELTHTNVNFTLNTYHQLANNFSASLLF